MKNGKLNLGQIEAIVNKLGGMSGVNQLLRGELVMTGSRRSWFEENGIIYFNVTSDGTSGEEWINCLERQGCNLDDGAKDILRSKDFHPTSGVTYEVAILKSKFHKNGWIEYTSWGQDGERRTNKIRKEAEGRQLITPNSEIACLIRKNFSDEEIKTMGISHIMTMHKPIKYGNNPSFLGVSLNHGGCRLYSLEHDPEYPWSDEVGFAFIVSQVDLMT